MTTDPGVDRAQDAVRIAAAYFDTKNYDRARDVLRGALAQSPNDPGLLAQYACAEFLLDDYVAAAQSAYAVFSVAPQHELAMRIYALSLEGLGRHHDAMWMAWRGVHAHPSNPVHHYVYARLLRNSGQAFPALQVVDHALRLRPADADALVLRGLILHDLNRIEDSDAAYRAALELDPGNAEALNNMAVNRLRRGKFGRALRGFLSAAGSDPALGNLARRNIGALMTNLLRRLTVVALALGLLVALVAVEDGSGRPTVTSRALTAVFTVGLVIALGWLLRAVPRPVLLSVLRQRGFLAARLLHAMFAVAVGAWVTIFGGPAWTIGAAIALIVAGLVLVRVGLIIGK